MTYFHFSVCVMVVKTYAFCSFREYAVMLQSPSASPPAGDGLNPPPLPLSSGPGLQTGCLWGVPNCPLEYWAIGECFLFLRQLGSSTNDRKPFLPVSGWLQRLFEEGGGASSGWPSTQLAYTPSQNRYRAGAGSKGTFRLVKMILCCWTISYTIASFCRQLPRPI